MEQKKKVCKRCSQEKRIWARGLCQSCDIIENPSKYKIEKKATKKKEKKESVTSLKKKLDTLFSIYIRQMYEVNGLVECYTCGVQKPLKSMQNGHFWSRSNLSVRWDEDNCRPQCVGCNVYKSGNYIIYTTKLLKEIGQINFDKLMQKKTLTFKPTAEWLKSQIEFYTLNIKQ